MVGAVEYMAASLQREKTHPHNKRPGYDTKKSDGEAPVMLELKKNWPCVISCPSGGVGKYDISSSYG